MSEDLGTIISLSESPSPSKMEFVVTKGTVHRGMFVELQYSEGTMIAMVTNLVKANRYFERAESVKEFESNGSALKEQFPASEWEFLVAETRPLGVFKGEKIKRSTFPPSPGTKVRIAEKKNLQKFLKLNEENGLHLGELEYHELPVKLSMTSLLQKHLAILAQSGFGKCVAPNSRLLLSTGEQVEIGSFVDGKLKNDFFVEDGVELAFNSDSNLKVISLNQNNSLELSEIKAFSRRKAPSEMIRIKTRTGKTLELTPEHLVPVANESIEWIPAKDLKESDFVLLPKPKIKGSVQTIDFIELWKESKKARVKEPKVNALIFSLLRQKNLLKKELAMELQVSKAAIYNWFNHAGIPLFYLQKICGFLGIDFIELKKEIRYLKWKQKRIPSFLKADKDFSRLMAYLLAEGHNTSQTIGFTNINLSIQKEFKELFSKVFNERVVEIKRKNHFNVYNQFLALSLKKLGFTSSSWTKYIPKEILLADEETLFNFLGAFIDCDGHISKRSSLIEICLASKKMINQLENIFLRLGIVPILRVKKVKGKEYSRLEISGARGNSILNKRIDLLIPHKRSRLKQWAKKTPNTNIDVIPNTHNHLRKIVELLGIPANSLGQGVTNYLKWRDSPSRLSLKRMIAILSNRVVAIEESIEETRQLYFALPSFSEHEALNIVSNSYSNGLLFEEIALNSGISSTTARRVVRGITKPANSIFALAQNVLQIQRKQRPDLETINSLNFNSIAKKIKTLCERLGCSTLELSKSVGLYKQALYGHSMGREPNYSVVLGYAKALNTLASEREKGLFEAKKRIAFLDSLLNSNLFFDQIIEVESFAPSYEYVYDLSVENHNFTVNNLLVHNSYSVSVLLEELLERKKEQGRIAVIVLDVHGEYGSFAEPVTDKRHSDYSNKTHIIKARDIRISVPRLSIGILSTMLPGLSIAQKRDLSRIISFLRKEMKSGVGTFDLKTIKSSVLKDEEIKDNTKKALNAWLNELEEYHLFSNVDSPSIEDLVKPGTLTVIDFHDIIGLKKKQIIVNYLAQKLFSERRLKKLPPFLLVLEEAHQFIPEKTSRERAIAKGILETIAREGRKFGASICLVSQRPIQLSTTVLSQCNNHLILRITNPYDLKHIGESSEGLDNRSIEMLTTLRVGEALLVGEATGFPVFFKVRERKSAESKHEISLEKAALQFEEKGREREEEAKQFL